MAELGEERQPELGAGLHQAEQHVAGDAPGFALGSARNLALGDMGADVVLRAVGVQRVVTYTPGTPPFGDRDVDGTNGAQPIRGPTLLRGRGLVEPP